MGTEDLLAAIVTADEAGKKSISWQEPLTDVQIGLLEDIGCRWKLTDKTVTKQGTFYLNIITWDLLLA